MVDQPVELSEEANEALRRAVLNVHQLGIIGSSVAAGVYDTLKPEANDDKIESLKRLYLDEGLGSVLETLMDGSDILQLGTVIDVGSGNGGSAATIMNILSPDNLILMDCDEVSLQYAMTNLERYKTDYDVGQNTQLSFLSGEVEKFSSVYIGPTVDLIVMRRLVRYIAENDRQNVFSQLSKSIKKGGKLIFDVPVQSPDFWMSEDLRPISVVARMLQEDYGIDEIEEAVNENRNPESILNKIGTELTSGGFSEISGSYRHTEVGAEHTWYKVEHVIESVLMMAVNENANRETELQANVEGMWSTLEKYIKEEFQRGPKSVGTYFVEAVN